jgi:hypothetical protein
MPISFHCESCKKKIKAPDGAGGKYGKCPFCDHRNYIPLPKSPDEDDITLAPIDESAETKYAELMKETSLLTQEILHEKDAGLDDEDTAPNEKDLLKNLIVYLVQMASGNLDAAAGTYKNIQPFSENAVTLTQQLAKASTPEPELAHIPAKVLQGLAKNLITLLRQ